MRFHLRRSLPILTATAMLAVISSVHQSQAEESIEVPRIRIKSQERSASGFQIEPISDKKIFAGKKTTHIEVEEAGPVPTNNYRQVATKTPGLVVSEVNNESYSSISYRGQGDPHESMYVMMLEDGLPVSADMYGYPASYYMPPMDLVDAVEFVRGGASLLYGPQAAGALNFKTRIIDPSRRITGRARLIGGGFGFAQGHLGLTGKILDTGYLFDAHGRQSQGFRDSNGDYSISGMQAKLSHNFSEKTRLNFKANIYQGRHGEPGGLAKDAALGVITFAENPNGTTTPNDRLEIDRHHAALSLEHDINADLSLEAQLWMTNLTRTSFRQASGGAPTFGGIKVGTTNSIDQHKFQTYGAQLKANGKMSIFDNDHTWVVGLNHYSSSAPFRQEQGSTAISRTGTLQQTVDRATQATSLYAESIFNFDQFRVIPGVRLEQITQNLNETYRSSGGTLRTARLMNDVALLSLGLEKDVLNAAKVYANFATGYRPPMFAQGLPLGQGVAVYEDLKEATSQSFELGLTGQVTDAGRYDVTVFDITHSDQIGNVGSVLQNVGRARYQGIEGLVSWDLLRHFETSGQSLELTLGGSLLSAEITAGGSAATLGKRPQYAPEQIWRTALAYRNNKGYSANLSGQWLKQHYGDDSNSAQFEIPSFQIWDLSAEMPTGLKDLKVQAMVTNLFGAKYTSRVRAAGIEPGHPTTFYAGLNYVF